MKITIMKTDKKPTFFTKFTLTTLIFINIILIISIITQIKQLNANNQPRQPIMQMVDKEFEKHIRHSRGISHESKLSEIQKNINIGLNRYNREWDEKEISRVALVLQKGEAIYNIPHQDILAIISIESNFNPKAINHNNNGTIDYGVAQINGINWERLSSTSKPILDKYQIYYIDDKYDMALNIMNSFVYLNNSEIELKRRNRFSYARMIQSYNVGIGGSLTSNANFTRIRHNYFNKFQEAKSYF